MTTRVVDLVIRARSEADRAVNSISAAVRDLAKAQEEVQASTSGSNSSIGKLASTLRTLERTTDRTGDKAARSFKQIEAAVDRASDALARQKADLIDTRGAYTAVKGQIEAAAAAVTRLETAMARAQGRRGAQGQFIGADQAAAEIARLEPQLAAAKAEFANLTRQSDRLSSSLTNQSQKTDHLESEYTRLKGAAAAGQIAMRQVGTSSEQTATSIGRAKEQLGRTAGEAKRAGSAMAGAAVQGNRLRDAFRGVYGEGRSAMTLMQRLRGEVLALTTAHIGLYGAIHQVGEILNAVMSIEAIENRLGAVFQQDATRVGEEMQWLEAQAERLGIEFGVLGNQYAQYAIAADTAGFSSQGIRNSFMAVAEAGRVMKLSNEEVEGTFYALVQMISKGKVQSEELRRQLGDRLPGAFQFMAEALGVTTGELDAMLERGEVIADESTLIEFADVLTERFGAQLPDALESTRTAIGRFENAVLQARRTVSEQGFDEAFKDALNDLTAFLQSDEGQEGLAQIGEGLAKLISLGPPLVRNFDAFLRVGQAFIALKLATVFTGIGRSMGSSMTAQARASLVQVRALSIWLGRTAATASGPLRTGLLAGASGLRAFRGAATAAVTAARGLWAAIGGLPGILLTGVSFILTELFGRWIGGVDEATSALRQHERTLERIQRAYQLASGDAEAFAAALSNMSVAEARADLGDLEESLESLRGRALRSVNRQINSRAATIGGDRGLVDELFRLRDGVAAGRMSLSEMRAEISRLQEEGAGFSDDFIQYLRELDEGSDDAGDGVIELTAAIARQEAQLRLLTGEATDADRVLLGLADSLDDVSESADASRIREFAEAVSDLRDAIPELRRFDRFASSMNDLTAARTRALENAAPGEEPAVNATFDQAQESLRREFLGSIDYDRILDRTVAAGAEDEIRRQAEEDLRRIARRLLDAGAEVTEENILGVQTGVSVESVVDGSADLSGARATLGVSEIDLARADELAERRRDLAEAQRDFNAALTDANQRAEYALSIAGETANEQEVLLAIYDAQAEARREEVQFSDTQAEQIRSRIESERELQAIETIRQKNAETSGEKQTEQDIVDLLQQRRQLLQEQIRFSREIGDSAQASLLEGQLEAVNLQLQDAILGAIAFWQAMGGPEAENAILTLQGLRRELEAAGSEAIVTGEQINEMLATGGADAFDRWVDEVDKGRNAIAALWDSFRQFASDFLRQIARMIMQQIILNALQNSGFGGQVASGVNISANVNHDGGVIGAAGRQRSVAASYFSNAVRYHTGGIVGLRPNERPIIAEVGEEMLTENDPRHRRNLGSGSGGRDVKIVNAIDAGDFIAKGMSTRQGEEVIMNFIRSKSDEVKAALG
jgi:tape measure domain-containing protein